ncbi:hypothetical protein GGF32_001496 [Allomyces javanicus]|nr:hypothetical protein GGF32_001496 [Allomyces javanicus]
MSSRSNPAARAARTRTLSTISSVTEASNYSSVAPSSSVSVVSSRDYISSHNDSSSSPSSASSYTADFQVDDAATTVTTTTVATSAPFVPRTGGGVPTAVVPIIGTSQAGKTTLIQFLHEYCEAAYDPTELRVGDGVNSQTKAARRFFLRVPHRQALLIPRAHKGASLEAQLFGMDINASSKYQVTATAQQQQSQQQQQHQVTTTFANSANLGNGRIQHFHEPQIQTTTKTDYVMENGKQVRKTTKVTTATSKRTTASYNTGSGMSSIGMAGDQSYYAVNAPTSQQQGQQVQQQQQGQVTANMDQSITKFATDVALQAAMGEGLYMSHQQQQEQQLQFQQQQQQFQQQQFHDNHSVVSSRSSRSSCSSCSSAVCSCDDGSSVVSTSTALSTAVAAASLGPQSLHQVLGALYQGVMAQGGMTRDEAQFEYLEQVEDLMHDRGLELVLTRPSPRPRLCLDLIDTPGLLDSAAFANPFVDLDHLTGILDQVKRAGSVTAIVYVINADRPYDSASLAALTTYLTNLRDLCTNLVVVHSSYNVHKAIDQAKRGINAGNGTAPVQSIMAGPGGCVQPVLQAQGDQFALFDLGVRASEFNKKLAELGFPDVTPIHVPMDNVVPRGARAGLQAVCYEGMHVLLDVLEQLATATVPTPIERVQFTKVPILRDMDVHVERHLQATIAQVRSDMVRLSKSDKERRLIDAAGKIAQLRAEKQRVDADLAYCDTNDQVEIDARSAVPAPPALAAQFGMGPNTAPPCPIHGKPNDWAVARVHSSCPHCQIATHPVFIHYEAPNVTKIRDVHVTLALPAGSVRVRGAHLSPDRRHYLLVADVAATVVPLLARGARGTGITAKFMTTRRDRYASAITRLHTARDLVEKHLARHRAELQHVLRALGEERRLLAEYESRVAVLERCVLAVREDRMPLDLFLEVQDAYRSLARSVLRRSARASAATTTTSKTTSTTMTKTSSSSKVVTSSSSSATANVVASSEKLSAVVSHLERYYSVHRH